MGDESMLSTAQDTKTPRKSKAAPAGATQRNYLGTSKVIKLPYIINTQEYKAHPYAGVVYMGDDELEQMDLHHEELEALERDKAKEDEML
jgi:hypothetical protein